MANIIRKIISLPEDLVREAEAIASTEGKTLSGVIQDALRSARAQRRVRGLRSVQGYWSRIARDRGILTESDLARYLRN